jgi:hypothetical protein
LFAAGAVLTWAGWSAYAQSAPGHDVPGYSQWLLQTIGDVGPLLVGSRSDLGQRLGAAGVILAAIGLATTAVSVWIVLGGDSDE